MRWPRYPSAPELETLFSLLPRAGDDQAPTTVGKFSRYKKEVADLPPPERQKLDAVAERIAASHEPGACPVVGVLVVGHADQDLARGRAFEHEISRERAAKVQRALRREVRARLARRGPFVHVDQIAMRSVGAGFGSPLHRHPATEAQRAENRRVVIYLARAMTPVAPVAYTMFPVPPQKNLPGTRPAAVPAWAPVKGASKAAVFTPGPPKRPHIKHDHGFLDDGHGGIDNGKRQPPTSADHASKEVWTAILKFGRDRRPELRDALDAYEHFLIHNNGAPRECNYEGFVRDDESGRTVLASALEDTRQAALAYYDFKYPVRPAVAQRDTFQMTSDVVVVEGDPLLGAGPNRYPYPATENWQKTLGGHPFWVDASFTVDTDPGAGTRRFEIVMRVHVEDMYNFDPNKADLATGTPDAANGRFEITALGREFLTTALLTRKITFTAPLAKQPTTWVPPDLVVTP